jgi:hypothetical protein
MAKKRDPNKGGILIHPTKSPAGLSLSAVKSAAMKLSAGSVLQAAAKKAATPAVRRIVPEVIGNALKKTGKILVHANPALEALKIVALNPTNRFPGSSAERRMMRDAIAKTNRAKLAGELVGSPRIARKPLAPASPLTNSVKEHKGNASRGKDLKSHPHNVRANPTTKVNKAAPANKPVRPSKIVPKSATSGAPLTKPVKVREVKTSLGKLSKSHPHLSTKLILRQVQAQNPVNRINPHKPSHMHKHRPIQMHRR